MNDEELEQRLRDELHERIRPPAEAPADLWARVDREITRERVSRPSPAFGAFGTDVRYGRARLGAVGGLAAAAAIVALVAGALLLRPTRPAVIAGPLPARVEMFSRVDANIAWAVNGEHLYITRDGGTTWSEGTLPGKGLGQIAAEPTPEPSCDPSGNCSYRSQFPERLYPDFIDADHGWVVTWVLSNPNDYNNSDFTLTVHRTSDGGRTWTAARVPGTYRGFGTASFVDRSHGVLAVYNMSAATTNGEAQAGSPAPQPTIRPEAAAGTTILTSSDGGATWAKKSTMSGIAIVEPVSEKEMWAGGAYLGLFLGRNLIRHSVDGGATWTEAALPLPSDCNTYTATFAVPVKTADGLETSVGCSSFATGGGEASATPAPTPYPSVAPATDLPEGIPVSQPSDGAVPGPAEPPAVSARIVTVLSHDGGATWTMTGTRTVDGAFFASIVGTGYFMHERIRQPLVVAIPKPGASTSSPSSYDLRASFDRGATWRSYAIVGLPGMPLAMNWASPDDLWVGAAGSYGGGAPSLALYATKDAGKTWHALMGSPKWPASPDPTPTPWAPPTGEPMPTDMPVPIANQPFDGIGLVSEESGWALRGSEFWTTENGGRSWAMIGLPFGYNGQAAAFDTRHIAQTMSDSSGDGRPTILVTATADGGGSWTKASIDLGATVPVNGGFGFDSRLHYVSASEVSLFIRLVVDNATMCNRSDSADAGATWSAARPVDCAATDATWTTPLIGWAWAYNPSTGADPTREVPLAVTIDGGKTWVSSTIAAPADIAGKGKGFVALVAEPSGGMLSAVVEWANPDASETTVQVLTSTDGGRTWSPQYTQQLPFRFGYPMFVAAGPGHWLGMTQSGNAATFVETLDGGATWQTFDSKLAGMPITLSFASEAVGWASVMATNGCDTKTSACPPPTIWMTRDGGRTWTQILEAH